MQRRGGKLILHSTAKPVRTVFTITGFDQIIEVARDGAYPARPLSSSKLEDH